MAILYTLLGIIAGGVVIGYVVLGGVLIHDKIKLMQNESAGQDSE